jgi:hypothetical protein
MTRGTPIEESILLVIRPEADRPRAIRRRNSDVVIRVPLASRAIRDPDKVSAATLSVSNDVLWN